MTAPPPPQPDPDRVVISDTMVAQEGGGGVTIRTVIYSDGSGEMETISPDGQVKRSSWGPV